MQVPNFFDDEMGMDPTGGGETSPNGEASRLNPEVSGPKGGGMLPTDIDSGGRFDVPPDFDPNALGGGGALMGGPPPPIPTGEALGGDLGGGGFDQSAPDATFQPPVPDVPLSMPPMSPAPPSRTASFSKIGPRPEPRAQRFGSGAANTGIGIGDEDKNRMILDRLGMGGGAGGGY